MNLVNELLMNVTRLVGTAPYDKLVNELFKTVTRLVDTAPYKPIGGNPGYHIF